MTPYHLLLADPKAPARAQSLLQGACGNGSQNLPAVIMRRQKSGQASLFVKPKMAQKIGARRH
ncbi:MAG: hypothetical protein CMG98_05280 [Marinovum sp.]|nr:hypothetical protein [Marinovum sp.]MBF21841.1 hypothetical protein [Marinovum sp.]HBY12044.1 hypothetical protein [Paracoccaceae bacterium]